jgi:hypothetical protein
MTIELKLIISRPCPFKIKKFEPMDIGRGRGYWTIHKNVSSLLVSLMPCMYIVHTILIKLSIYLMGGRGGSDGGRGER